MIQKIIQWLDKEVKKKENIDDEVRKLGIEMPETKMYLWGKYVEAAYIRDKLRQVIDTETESQPLPKDKENNKEALEIMDNVLDTEKVVFITQEDGIIHHGKSFARRFIDEDGNVYTSSQITKWWEEIENTTDPMNLTGAVNITIGKIISMIEHIAETEYHRGYVDALNEKELTEKHWKQADVMDLLHDSWKERIKDREDKTE